MSEPYKVHLHDQGVDAINVQYSLLVDDNVLVQFNTFSDLTAEQVREAVERYLATAPAPAGDREAFEAAYVKVCGYPAATIANFWEPTQQYYMDDGLQSHWLLWDARASSPAPALGLTAEDREQIRQARVRDPQVHREALSIHERDRRNLLAIIDRCFPRLTTPAPALERRVPGGPACPTCGFKITVGKKPPFMSDDDPAPMPELSEAVRDVAAERKRQIEVEGWTAEHDDEHRRGEMASAAACYATGSTHTRKEAIERDGLPTRVTGWKSLWPWDLEWWKPKDKRRDLVRAAALIVAEIERLDRLTTPADGEGGR